MGYGFELVRWRWGMYLSWVGGEVEVWHGFEMVRWRWGMDLSWGGGSVAWI